MSKFYDGGYFVDEDGIVYGIERVDNKPVFVVADADGLKASAATPLAIRSLEGLGLERQILQVLKEIKEHLRIVTGEEDI